MIGDSPTGRFCAALGPIPDSGADPTRRDRAAMLSATFWGRDKELTIGFFGGSQALRERVRDLAMAWLDRTGARLSFQFWTAGDVAGTGAAIRIAFDRGKGSWSWIGTQAMRIAADLPTMNLGWMTPELDERSARAVVLHEFGHAIGLIHEHLHPLAAIDWDRPRVLTDLRSTQGWDEDTVAANMFKAPPANDVFATAPDPRSIMMYPIPPEWTRNGVSTGWNDDLSPDDIRLIQSAYGIRRGWKP
jgi:hypothetical protein